jgi:hypothetical protein
MQIIHSKNGGHCYPSSSYFSLCIDQAKGVLITHVDLIQCVIECVIECLIRFSHQAIEEEKKKQASGSDPQLQPSSSPCFI